MQRQTPGLLTAIELVWHSPLRACSVGMDGWKTVTFVCRAGSDPGAAATKVLADRSNSAKSVLLRILSIADYPPFTAAAVSALIRPAANAAGTPHRLSADEKAGREAACRPAPSSSLQPARRRRRLGNWLRKHHLCRLECRLWFRSPLKGGPARSRSLASSAPYES